MWKTKPEVSVSEFFATLAAIFFGQAVVTTVNYLSPNDSIDKIAIMWILMVVSIMFYAMVTYYIDKSKPSSVIDMNIEIETATKKIGLGVWRTG